MSTLKITEAGQLTLTPELLKYLGIQQGDEVISYLLPGGRIELRAQPRGKISDAFGMLKGKTDRVLSIEEIGRMAAKGRANKR
jgi:bifunctional DNA-binding transcriptional regulator/antitoxin component of YhaV-PrlF toxin-antitoxin module